MRVTKIYIERTKTEPGFNNKKIGIEIEVNEGDKAVEVLSAGEKFLRVAFNEQQRQVDLLDTLEKLRVSEMDDLPF